MEARKKEKRERRKEKEKERRGKGESELFTLSNEKILKFRSNSFLFSLFLFQQRKKEDTNDNNIERDFRDQKFFPNY